MNTPLSQLYCEKVPLFPVQKRDLKGAGNLDGVLHTCNRNPCLEAETGELKVRSQHGLQREALCLKRNVRAGDVASYRALT